MSEYVRAEAMDNLWNMWLTELNKHRAGLTLKVSRVLYSDFSNFQRIDVVDTEEYGKVLVLYGSIMITERDEFVYHEMISQPALNVHPNPKEVLIIGGGDGGTLRDTLRNPQVQRATMVEIDQQVVEVSKRFFPTVASQFDNPRARILFDDGAAFVANTKDKFDVVMSDASDPVGPAEVLFQTSFYQNIYNCLNDDGIFVAQSESPWYHADNVAKIYKNLRSVFPIVRMYVAHIPTYPSALWSFAFCSKTLDPLTDFKGVKVADAELTYYNQALHSGCFALPSYVARNIAS
jgi:spermidine synthase